MCGSTSPTVSPLANLAAGNADANINTISNTGGEFNSQLQTLLGGIANQPTADPTPIDTGFSNFAGTGGISPTDVSNLSDQASEAARSTYQTGSDAASRQIAATGGYGPSGAIESSLAREGSNAASRAAVDSGASITGLRTTNQLAGLTGQEGLYNTNVNQVQQLLNTILGNFGTTSSQINNAVGIKAGLAPAPGPSLLSQIGGGLAAVGAIP